MNENDKPNDVEPAPPTATSEEPSVISTQFSLRTMFLMTTLFGLLFGICYALRLPPMQLLAAFVFSAVTALMTIIILHAFVLARISRSQGDDYLQCPKCLAKYPDSLPRSRCRYCGQML